MPDRTRQRGPLRPAEVFGDLLDAFDQAGQGVGGGVAVGHGDEQRESGGAFGEAHMGGAVGS